MTLRFATIVCVGFALAVSAWSAGANAQDAKDEGWKGVASLEVAPSYKRTTTDDTVKDAAEIGDFSLAVKLTSPPVLLSQPIVLKLGGTYSPIRFDEKDKESTWFIEGQIGDTYLDDAVFRGRYAGHKAEDFEAAVKGSVGLLHTQKYGRFYAAPAGNSETAKAAIEYRRLLWHYCAVAEVANRIAPSGICDDGSNPKSSFGFAVGANASRTWSTTPTDENRTYGTAAKLLFPPVRRLVVPTFSASGDRILYDLPTTPGLPDRKDWKYKLAGGVELTPLLSKFKWIEIAAEVTRTWLDSNDPTQSSREWNGSLSIGIKWGFLGR